MIQPEVAFSILVAAGVFFGMARYHRDLVGFYFTKVTRRSKISRQEFLVLYKFLNDHFPFFKPLSDRGKSQFIDRMWHFRRSKGFSSSGDLELTDEMMNYVSGAATQLTFGLDDFMIRSHPIIVLHAEHFYLPGTRHKMKGAASQSGQIHLSWPDLKKGFEIPDDRYN